MASQTSESVEREVRIQARPETVFSFLTDPAKMIRWMGSNVTIDPRPGGIYRVQISDQNIARGEYVEVSNGRVVFTFGWEGDESPVPPGSTTVEITLTPDGDETVVRLRHSGLPEPAREQHAEGWEHYLARLAAAAEGRDPGPDSLAAPADEAG